MRIMRLDKEMTLENINNLIKIDKIIPDDTWAAENFLMDLDHKWDFSFIATENDCVIGFLICSIKKNKLHVHRIAVLPEYQQKKIGRAFIKRLSTECYKAGINKITLKVKDSNLVALEFYKRLGFKKIGIEDSRYLFEKKLE